MTVVIPYKKEIFDGLELKYCLRAIEKNLTGWSNVIVIGTPPEWYRGEWVKANDHDGRKQFSIYQKLLTAREHSTEYFAMFNDDHFLLKSIETDEIRYWYNHSLKDELNQDLTARYRQTVFRTFELFPEGLNYDIHAPIVYNKIMFKELFQDRTDEICIKSLYCNSLKIKGEMYSDVKINNLMSKDQITEKIKDKLFLSTGTTAVKPPLIEVLNELYPMKSQWEK